MRIACCLLASLLLPALASAQSTITLELRDYATVPITGAAASVCLMHTRLVHGSDANRSSRPRGLYICVYTAADAVPIARNPMANPNEGLIVRGKAWPKGESEPDGWNVELEDTTPNNEGSPGIYAFTNILSGTGPEAFFDNVAVKNNSN